MPFAVAAIGIAAVGTGYQIYSGEQAKDDARAAGDKQQKINRLEGDEEIRRISEEQRAWMGQTEGEYAASGVKMEGSPLEVMAKQAYEFDLERYYTEEKVKAGAEVIAANQRSTTSSIRAKQVGALTTGLQSSINTAYNTWG